MVHQGPYGPCGSCMASNKGEEGGQLFKPTLALSLAHGLVLAHKKWHACRSLDNKIVIFLHMHGRELKLELIGCVTRGLVSSSKWVSLILATLDGLDVGLLGDVICEDDYDDMVEEIVAKSRGY
ncbi:hypothetical protein Tco_1042838 [Tanacetum coccineum]|uniref:Uncharacterized protein n=1 Tax=Tanacetum coccineum TaxID=301880 RepID=A0ABQ5GKS3_9ASTR